MVIREFIQTISEVFGRFSIFLLAAVGINRTQWYQSFNQQIPLTEPFGWIIAYGIIGSIFWMILPIVNASNIFVKGQKNE